MILPDALMHGARAEKDEARCLANFWGILQNNVDELALLKDTFVGRGLADPQRLGVGGVSMGGMTTMAALVKFPWVKVAANLMGSGYFARLSHHLFPLTMPVTSYRATCLSAKSPFTQSGYRRQSSVNRRCSVVYLAWRRR